MTSIKIDILSIVEVAVFSFWTEDLMVLIICGKLRVLKISFMSLIRSPKLPVEFLFYWSLFTLSVSLSLQVSSYFCCGRRFAVDCLCPRDFVLEAAQDNFVARVYIDWFRVLC